MIYNNVLEAIGHTPMIRLNRMNKPGNADILVKFEGLNVGGSIKTRTAYNMIINAEREGKIKPDTIIVEPTSGNQGIGLALVGAVKGYKTITYKISLISQPRHQTSKKGQNSSKIHSLEAQKQRKAIHFDAFSATFCTRRLSKKSASTSHLERYL